jgi:hypothetical protein
VESPSLDQDPFYLWRVAVRLLVVAPQSARNEAVITTRSDRLVLSRRLPARVSLTFSFALSALDFPKFLIAVAIRAFL